jgi:hypothetical protein
MNLQTMIVTKAQDVDTLATKTTTTTTTKRYYYEYNSEQKLIFVYYNRVKFFNALNSDRLVGIIAYTFHLNILNLIMLRNSGLPSIIRLNTALSKIIIRIL